MSDPNADDKASSSSVDNQGRTRRPLPQDGGDATIDNPVARSDAVDSPVATSDAPQSSRATKVAIPVAAVALAALVGATLPLASPENPRALGPGGWVYLVVALLTAIFLFIPTRR